MSKNVFNTVRVRKPNTNWFNLSHDVKLSGNMGQLIPTLIQEAIPGDKFKITCNALVRFAPLVAPIMHNINLHMHYFFVPNRLVWPQWEDFMSPPKQNSQLPAWPYFNVNVNVRSGELGDYMGLPLNNNQMGNVSAIPFAAYNKIWNEYYRDQNLQDPIPDTLTSGSNTNFDANFNVVRRRSWMHDYFTGALPFVQKGAPVDIPLKLSGYAPVVRDTPGGESSWDDDDGEKVWVQAKELPNATNEYLYTDLSANAEFSNSSTINDLRLAMRAQEWLEKQARGGSRYIEQIRMHFSVKSSDARLNRPEFIGSISSPIVISEVLQTAPPTSDGSEATQSTPQGNMAGHGIGAGVGKTYTYFAEEHGYVFGILSVTPKTAYQQGIPKHFLRASPYDYAWPTFAHLGEQVVQNKEIYCAPDGYDPYTFGYVPRYSEYRYTPSRVAGDFRDNLAFWHLGRIFDARPNLNAAFIECNPRMDIFAVRGEQENPQNLWMHVNNRVKVRRALPKYGTPTL